MTRTLILLRHGRTAWNDTGRAQGHADVPLDEFGRAQADAAAAYFADVPLGVVWTSDLARARETAEIVAAGRPVKADARFREYDVGERQGLTVPEVAERWPELGSDWELGNPPAGIPGSETYDDVAARIVPACREVLESLQSGETGLVVTHGACSKVAVAGLLGWPQDVISTLRGLDNCHFAILEERVRDGRIRLAGYGVPPISRS
ncbi:MAG TPA: histidine phosphatase family protein [Nocardioidaceae bacterium]|nr:histidine phosphatase family protein [Nocardioidaceae bacterium]